MRVLLYTIKRSLAKLNIKPICCNESTDYKMLAKFFPDIFALSLWEGCKEGCNSHILGYRMSHF